MQKLRSKIRDEFIHFFCQSWPKLAGDGFRQTGRFANLLGEELVAVAIAAAIDEGLTLASLGVEVPVLKVSFAKTGVLWKLAI